MSPHLSRRRFALTASSLGAALMTSPLNVLAKQVRALLVYSEFPRGARPNMATGKSNTFPSAGAASQSQADGQTKPKVLVFDVNQTMLDLNALRPQFARVFGDGKALDEGFSLLLHYSLVLPLPDPYPTFAPVRTSTPTMPP